LSAGLVVDCSVAASWCFRDEASAATDAILERVRNEGGLVPALWNWEIANVLAVAVRRGRMSVADATANLSDLALLPIALDANAPARAWRETFLLAQAHKLTVYDAAYLELAQRTGLELASKDAELVDAARAVGVKVVP
jgi:predicted nucleic acid-binding protein